VDLPSVAAIPWAIARSARGGWTVRVACCRHILRSLEPNLAGCILAWGKNCCYGGTIVTSIVRLSTGRLISLVNTVVPGLLWLGWHMTFHTQSANGAIAILAQDFGCPHELASYRE